MGETAVLSEVLVRNNRLLLTIKDKGTIYVKRTHRFPTKVLTPELREQLKAEFKDYNPVEYNRIPKFNILQITSDTGLFDRLKEQDPEKHKLLKQRFVSGHYVQQARWENGLPWTITEPNEQLIKVLNEKTKSDRCLAQAIKDAETAVKQIKKNRIKKYETYTANHWNRLKDIIPDTPITAAEQERSELENKVRQFYPTANVETNPKDKSYDIILETNPIKTTRGLTADEILNSRLYIIDIEKPLFNTKDEEVSWVQTILMDKGKVIKKTIRTLRNTGKTKLRDWDIELYNTEQEIVDAVRREITTPDQGRTVDAIAAYNAPYDLENTKEAGDLDIGERETDPKVEVAVDFFRKLKVHGKLVLDPLRQARIRYRHLPNRKFELVLAEAQNIPSAKIINYDQLARLEQISKTGDTSHLNQDLISLIEKQTKKKLEEIKNLPEACAEIEATYGADDVDNLQKMLFSDWYKDHLTDCCFISQTYKVELSRILHSVKTVNDAQERCYFDFVGTFRDVVYKKFKKMIQLQQKGRNHINARISERLCQKSAPGLHKNVCKTAIPTGLWLSEHVAGINPNNTQARFTEIKTLTEYASKFKNDKLRYFALNQYIDSLADYLIIDFGLLEKARSQYHTLLAEKGVEYKSFEDAYKEISNELRPLPAKLGKIPQPEFWAHYRNFRETLIQKSEWGIVHLHRGTLTAKGITSHADAELKAFWKKYDIDAEKFAELLRAARSENHALQRARQLPESTLEQHLGPKARKLMSDYHVNLKDLNELVKTRSTIEKRERTMFGQYNVRAKAVKDTLVARIDNAIKFIRDNGYQIIHAQAGFVYLAGTDSAPLKHPDAPLILVDEIPRAYVAINPSDTRERTFSAELKHKIFYPKHNYYEGIKVTDRPSNTLSLFEMKCYAPMIEAVMKNDYEAALSHANESLDQLRQIIKAKKADIKAWKKQVGKEMIDKTTYDPFLTVSKIELVWHAKKTDRYKAFEAGELIQFVTEPKPNVEIKTEPQTQRHYFEEPARKNSEKTRRVYIMAVDQLKPDIKMFYERIQARIRDFIEPITGHWEAEEFVKKPKRNVSFYVKINDIFELFNQRV